MLATPVKVVGAALEHSVEAFCRRLSLLDLLEVVVVVGLLRPASFCFLLLLRPASFRLLRIDPIHIGVTCDTHNIWSRACLCRNSEPHCAYSIALDEPLYL